MGDRSDSLRCSYSAPTQTTEQSVALPSGLAGTPQCPALHLVHLCQQLEQPLPGHRRLNAPPQAHLWLPHAPAVTLSSWDLGPPSFRPQSKFRLQARSAAGDPEVPWFTQLRTFVHTAPSVLTPSRSHSSLRSCGKPFLRSWAGRHAPGCPAAASVSSGPAALAGLSVQECLEVGVACGVLQAQQRVGLGAGGTGVC